MAVSSPLHAERRPQRLFKLAVAVAAFTATATAAGGLTVSSYMKVRQPLPDTIGGSGRCAIWLVGSSSVHRWTQAPRDLPGWRVHNRGVEGARLGELAARLAHTTIDPAPAAMILYAGENDIADGASGEAAARALLAMVRDLRTRGAAMPIFVVSMKPSPARWRNRPAQRCFDAVIGAQAGALRFRLLDVSRALLVDGRPGDFYRDDGIHLDDGGYRRWGTAIGRAVVAASSSIVNHCGLPNTTGQEQRSS